MNERRFIRHPETGKRAWIRRDVADGSELIANAEGFDLYVEIRTGRMYAVLADTAMTYAEMIDLVDAIRADA